MAQLKMYRLPADPVEKLILPEGYTVSNYKTEDDKLAWCEICKKGLVDDDAGKEKFDECITSNSDIKLNEDVFFIDHNGEHIGTITAYHDTKENIGQVHMVGIRTDYRGRGLGKYLNNIAIQHLEKKPVRFFRLTTDEWRKGAVKSYLTAGFIPVEYNLGMQDRWEKVLEDYNIESVQMVYEDATPYKVIYKKSIAPKIKFGVLGAGRGQSMMEYCSNCDNAELVAVCDCYEPLLKEAEEKYGNGKTKFFSDFDEFLKEDMDCVVLANFANEHQPYAIKCLKAGKNVLSELLPVQTMAQAVELVETIEETGKIYAYVENCCFMPAPKKMKELYLEGMLGSFEYGEGEYMHNCEDGWDILTRAEPTHWRNTMSAFYYCTHSLGPLIHITGLRPVSVTGFEAPHNARMQRMGALGGAFGVEILTLENGAILKSTHGVGPSKNSTWYTIYGSKGRMESARVDTEKGEYGTLYVNCDKNEGDNNSKPYIEDVSDDLSEVAEKAGHGGSDYHIMYNMVTKLRGNRNADVIDIYEALDMFLPGMFAYRSVLAGGIPMKIPNLRNKEERDKWRNDTQCTDPAVAGDMYIPSYSKGNPKIPPENYARLKRIFDSRKKTEE